MRVVNLGAVPALGQLPGEWMDRARKAVGLYADVLAEASKVANDDARGEILKWIGRADVPGSPAERYYAAAQDLMAAQASGPDSVYGQDLARRRVEQLEDAASEFSNRVSSAMESYGSLEAPAGAAGKTQAGVTATCVTGGIALLGLVVIPLLVLD